MIQIKHNEGGDFIPAVAIYPPTIAPQVPSHKKIKKTEYVLLSNFVAYWLVLLPLGYYPAFVKGYNLTGFWIGLVVASCVLYLTMGGILIPELRQLKRKFCDKLDL